MARLPDVLKHLSRISNTYNEPVAVHLAYEDLLKSRNIVTYQYWSMSRHRINFQVSSLELILSRPKASADYSNSNHRPIMTINGAVVSLRKDLPGHDLMTKVLSIPSPASSRSRASTVGSRSIPVPGFTRIPSPVNVKKSQRDYSPGISMATFGKASS